MIYWENEDGTFCVPYWLITYSDGSTMTVYTQKLVLDHMADDEFETVEIKHSVRYREPQLGTKVEPR